MVTTTGDITHNNEQYLVILLVIKRANDCYCCSSHTLSWTVYHPESDRENENDNDNIDLAYLHSQWVSNGNDGTRLVSVSH